MKTTIDSRVIGKHAPPYIVGEISANHNGKIDNAFELINMAKRCGADAVKLQTYKPDTLTLKSTNSDFKITEGIWAGYTLYDLYDWAHTPWEWHLELYNYAKEQKITIFSTPFDLTSVDFLESLDSPAYKIASFECVDLELIKVAAQTKKPLIISTGMAQLTEIEDAVDVALEHGSGDLCLLHCVSQYPASAHNYNLAKIADLEERFGVQVGLSDHTLDNTTAIAAVALGAVMIEKHITLDRQGGGPDDIFSLEEKEFSQLCEMTRTAWTALGEAKYTPTSGEKSNLKFRRSLYFVNSLNAGDIVKQEDVKSVRPGYGLPPKYLDKVIGSKLVTSVEKNTPVTENNVNLKRQYETDEIKNPD